MSSAVGRPRPAPDLAGATEAELICAARARDEAATRELIRRLNPRLFRLARGLAASDAEAEEIVQDAWLAAFSGLESFRGEARFSTWITRIAINAAKMRARRARPHEEYDTVTEATGLEDTVLAFPRSAAEQPDAALGQARMRDLLERTVAELPPELRVVFLLREAEGMSAPEVARDLGLNPLTVKTRLFRARRRLRREIERRLDGGFEAIFPFGGARCAAMADRVIAELGLGRRGPGG